jgi:hypothetical protein
MSAFITNTSKFISFFAKIPNSTEIINTLLAHSSYPEDTTVDLDQALLTAKTGANQAQKNGGFSSGKFRQGLGWNFPKASRNRPPPYTRIRQSAGFRQISFCRHRALKPYAILRESPNPARNSTASDFPDEYYFPSSACSYSVQPDSNTEFAPLSPSGTLKHRPALPGQNPAWGRRLLETFSLPLPLLFRKWWSLLLM